MHNLSWSSFQINVSIVRDNDEFWVRTVQSSEKEVGSSLGNATCMIFWIDLPSKWREMKLNPRCQYILINMHLIRAQPQAYLTQMQVQRRTWPWKERHVLQDIKKCLRQNCNSAMVSRKKKPFPNLAQNVQKYDFPIHCLMDLPITVSYGSMIYIVDDTKSFMISRIHLKSLDGKT